RADTGKRKKETAPNATSPAVMSAVAIGRRMKGSRDVHGAEFPGALGGSTATLTLSASRYCPLTTTLSPGDSPFATTAKPSSRAATRTGVRWATLSAEIVFT